jgi:hypothetical protein
LTCHSMPAMDALPHTFMAPAKIPTSSISSSAVFQFSKRLARMPSTSNRLSFLAVGVFVPTCARVILFWVLKYAEVAQWIMPYVQHNLQLHRHADVVYSSLLQCCKCEECVMRPCIVFLTCRSVMKKLHPPRLWLPESAGRTGSSFLAARRPSAAQRRHRRPSAPAAAGCRGWPPGRRWAGTPAASPC